jgi:endonuclease YncB( thermonuclease family)
MNRKPTYSPPNSRASKRSPGTGFTPQQKLILALAGFLVTAWIAVAVIFVLSARASGAGPASAPTQAGGLTSLPPGGQANPSSSGGANPQGEAILIPISAACAQANGGAQEGTVTRVDAGGLLEVSTPAGVIQSALAGITLQPGEKSLNALREMTGDGPVVLVRDLSSPAEAGAVHRYVFTRDLFINYELVRQGMAALDPAAPEQSCAAAFQLAGQKARSERLGMWEPTRAPTLTFVPLVTLDASNQPACDCSRRYECSDFATHAEAQACYNACNDYNSRLDLDRNGIACEALP